MRFNEEVEKGSKSDNEKHGDKIEEYDVGVEVSTVEDIARETPLFVEAVDSPDGGGPTGPDFGEDPVAPGSPAFPDPPDFEIPEIEVPDPNEFENPFDDLGDQIDFGEIDFSDSVGLLQAQLQMMNILTDLLVRMASQQQSMLNVNQDIQSVARGDFEVNRRILQNARPFQLVTVSGVNDIQNPNNPEVVVPESDESNIPTRELMIKSSRNNNEKIWFGDSDVSPNSGFSLSPGEGTSLEVDLREQQLYMSSPEADQVIELLGVV